jgi:D-alanyl-D-alanine dipeptidase
MLGVSLWAALWLGASAGCAAAPQAQVAPAQTGREQGADAVKAEKEALPDGFVYLADIVPGVLLDIRYAGSDNFVGAPIDGYEAPVAILTRDAAEALALVADDLRPQGLRLLVYDAYRPQRAVAHFMRWAQDAGDTRMQAAYYPGMDKSKLFEAGYVAKKSGHSRGSTVDLTLADADGAPLDMGGGFDLMDPISAHGAKGLTREQAANRRLLRRAMEARGFRAYTAEWWHYTRNDEVFPDFYFDFPVK